jgi:hypothetical protein
VTCARRRCWRAGGAACRMGLEGMVSKHRDRAYGGGRCAHWVKVKNPSSPAMKRAYELDWAGEQTSCTRM